jgi:hypothetical protein
LLLVANKIDARKTTTITGTTTNGEAIFIAQLLPLRVAKPPSRHRHSILVDALSRILPAFPQAATTLASNLCRRVFLNSIACRSQRSTALSSPPTKESARRQAPYRSVELCLLPCACLESPGAVIVHSLVLSSLNQRYRAPFIATPLPAADPQRKRNTNVPAPPAATRLRRR